MRFITKAAQPTALFIGECTPHLIKLRSKSFFSHFAVAALVAIWLANWRKKFCRKSSSHLEQSKRSEFSRTRDMRLFVSRLRKRQPMLSLPFTIRKSTSKLSSVHGERSPEIPTTFRLRLPQDKLWVQLVSHSGTGNSKWATGNFFLTSYIST